MMSRVNEDTSVAAESDSNPYRAPAANYAAPEYRAIQGWLRTALRCLLFVVVVGLVLETIDHETVVGTGPLLFITGMTVFILAMRERDYRCSLIGAAAMALCLLVVFLINHFNWGPAQGDKPITLLAWCYSIVTVPMTLRLLLLSRQE